MNDDAFWDLIETIDTDLLAEGDEEGAVEPLVTALAALPPDRIEAFEEQLAQKLYALDSSAHADAAGESGQSGDGFLYARCHVVAHGRERYEAVLSDPDEMPESLEEWCESLLSVAQQAYESSTGGTWEFEASVSYETGSNSARWGER